MARDYIYEYAFGDSYSAAAERAWLRRWDRAVPRWTAEDLAAATAEAAQLRDMFGVSP